MLRLRGAGRTDGCGQPYRAGELHAFASDVTRNAYTVKTKKILQYCIPPGPVVVPRDSRQKVKNVTLSDEDGPPCMGHEDASLPACSSWVLQRAIANWQLPCHAFPLFTVFNEHSGHAMANASRTKEINVRQSSHSELALMACDGNNAQKPQLFPMSNDHHHHHRHRV